LLEESDNINLNKLIYNLNALVDLGEVATTTKDYKSTIKSALYLVMGTLSVSKGVIFHFDPQKNELKNITSKGINDLNGIKLKLKKDEVKELIDTNTIIKRENSLGNTENLITREKVFLDKIKAFILAPLVVKGHLVGMIALGKKFSGGEYWKSDYDILTIMVHHIAIDLHNHNLMHKLSSKVNENQKLYRDLRLIYYDTIQAFATAIDAKDAYTQGHSLRVSNYCVAIAREMGFSSEQIEGIKIAGLLHDIGKITVEKSIINKPAKLTKKEQLEINQHPVISFEILAKIRFPWKNLSTDVRHHHEMLDGSGYPDRLQGEAIPTGSKILTLADAFDAMTTDRPYRKRLTLENTLEEIRESLGRHFDLKIVKSFILAIKKDVNSDKKMPIFGQLGSLSSINQMEKQLEATII